MAGTSKVPFQALIPMGGNEEAPMQSQSMIVPTSSMWSVYSNLNVSRNEETINSVQEMISTTAKEEGRMYAPWTQLGPKILLHNVFCSGSAAKAP